MVETLLIALLVLVTGTLIVSIILLTRNSLSDFDKQQERMGRSLKEEMTQNRGEASLNAKQLREEIVNSMTKISNLQKDQLDIFSTQLTTLTRTNEQKLDKMRETVEERLKILQEDNTKKLDQMRETVDEKLHATLEKRLGESFKLVSERLEMVHKGLGEMQSLAVGVGDLKKVLSNVKTRGILGEIQLGNILEQLLTPDQYAKNVITKEGSRENVEFAIKLPGKNDSGKVIYLPLDSKFPLEHYHSLVDAYEHGDNAAIEEATKLLENTIKKCAKEVRDKYIDPPNTTDFGIMFLPVEGLYAEVTRRTSLIEVLQRDFKIIITGPTTLAAILNSLQMGFRTLAVEKRSSEVWMLLGAVKTEFGKFGEILEKTRKKLSEATDVVDKAGVRSRAIERKLKDVQELPPSKAVKMLEDHTKDETL
ncbi:MAG: DNA recombination protein RmuC [Thermodesulfovibrionia bacterium]|nr:DNA recombination protein RmuC [Thermodesulfovibrionia bacterium]